MHLEVKSIVPDVEALHILEARFGKFWPFSSEPCPTEEL
jgi:hypothetical protein